MQFHDEGYMEKVADEYDYETGQLDYLPGAELEMFPPPGYDMFTLPVDPASQSENGALEEILEGDDMRVRSLDRIP